MMNLKELAEKTGDAIAIHYVSLDDLKDTFLDGNSKKHDTDKIIESIRRYGFRDPIAFDANLNDGNGGIIEGNGRLESLIEMKSQHMNLPRGLKEGWKVPVIFGVNATSEAEAVAFSVEHNWSVIWGSEIDLEQVASMFDDQALQEQLKMLDRQNSLPLSLDNNLNELLEILDYQQMDDPQYDVLEDDDAEAESSKFANEVRKSIQIEFKPDDYDYAYGVINQARKAKIYIGEILISKLEELLSAKA